MDTSSNFHPIIIHSSSIGVDTGGAGVPPPGSVMGRLGPIRPRADLGPTSVSDPRQWGDPFCKQWQMRPRHMFDLMCFVPTRKWKMEPKDIRWQVWWVYSLLFLPCWTWWGGSRSRTGWTMHVGNPEISFFGGGGWPCFRTALLHGPIFDRFSIDFR